MPLPPFDALARRILGREPDTIEPILNWGDHACVRVTLGPERFAIKTDTRPERIACELAGHRQAELAGVLVPEIVAADDHTIAMRWIEGVALTRHRSDAAWRDAGRHLRRIHELDADGLFGAGLDVPRSTWRASVEAELDDELDGCIREFDFGRGRAEHIRDECKRAGPLLDAPYVGWCHGDFQPDHVLVDPHSDDVVAIIDWSDHGKADAGWDFAVVTLDDASPLDALLDGYEADSTHRERLTTTLPLYRVVRWLGEARWLAARHHPGAVESLARATEWSAP